MRVTNQYLFDNFKNDHNSVLKELNRLTTQISSGQKIQNSYEDSSVYTDILRFDSQINELKDIKERAKSAQSMSDATDSALSEFNQTLRDFQTKLISAGNATTNSDNLEAIATELTEMKKHLISVANTQVNGEYLFSGSAVNIKPIDNNGNYHGNSDAIMTPVGEGIEIQSNIDGKSLFLGDDLHIQKNIKTNVRLQNQISDEPLTSQSTIREMVGDDDNESTNDKPVHFFISGTKRDGKAFKDIVLMQSDAKIEDLLKKIEDSYDNSVKVELTENGNISITDLKSGYSQIEFKMVGIQGLNPPDETNLNSATGDKIISFSKSNYKSIDPTKDESLQMDQSFFDKKGGVLESNVALIDNEKFATRSSRFNSMMGISQMPDKLFKMSVTDIDGNSKDIDLDLKDSSTFTVDGTTYSIFNADGSVTKADDFTMGQLNDIIAMTLSGKLPYSGNSASDFNSAIKDAREIIDVSINSSGHLQIQDRSNNLSKIEFAIYDNDANDFSKKDTPSISFMSNNAVTTSKSNIDFFKEIDEIIEAVRGGIRDIDANSKNPRNIGIESAISKIEQLSNHFSSAQAQIGIRSKSLQTAQDKASILEVNVMQLKSDKTEVDMAETAMKLNEVTLSYQAMLQTISKVNSLSLLNYMK